MISRLRYTFREMWASLSRNLTLTVAAVITSTVSLFLFGMTLLIQQGFDNQLSEWTGGVEMIVYVKHGATPDQVTYLEGALLSQTSVIKSVEYCDETCSAALAGTLLAGDPGALEQLLPGIPSLFRVTPIDQSSGAVLRSLKAEFKSLPNVYDVKTPDSDRICPRTAGMHDSQIPCVNSMGPSSWSGRNCWMDSQTPSVVRTRWHHAQTQVSSPSVGSIGAGERPSSAALASRRTTA